MSQSTPSETQPLLENRVPTTSPSTLRQRLSHSTYFPVIWLFPVVALASISLGISAFARFGYYQDTFCPTEPPAPRPPLHIPCGYFVNWVILPGVTVKMDMTATFGLFVVSFATVGWWSSVGDRRGRRPVLFISLLGALLVDLVYLIAGNIPAIHKDAQDTLSLGVIIHGLLGGVATYNGAVLAYASDVSPTHLSRSVIFSVLQAVYFVGFRIGAVIGAVVGPTLPHSSLSYILSVVIAATNLTYIYFILPESLPPASAEQTPGPSRSAAKYIFLPFSTFFHPWKHLFVLALAIYMYCWTLGRDTYILKLALQRGYFPSLPRWLLVLLPGILSLSTLLCIIPALASLFKTLYGNNLKSAISFGKSIAQNSILIATVSVIGILVFGMHRQGFIFTAFFFLHPFSAGTLPALYSLAASYFVALQREGEIGVLFGALSIWVSLAEHFSYPASWDSPATAFFLVSAVLLLIPDGPPVPAEDPRETGGDSSA